MEVYIENVILDNLIINFMILYITISLLKIDIKFRKLLMISIFATVYAIIIPLINISFLLNFLIKLCVGANIVFLIKKYKQFYEFIITYLVFISSTFLMGGLCYFIINLTGSFDTTGTILVYVSKIPMGAILLFICLYTYIVLSLIKMFNKQKKLNNYIYNLTLVLQDSKIKCKGFLDSGNTLVDDINGYPIIIVNRKIIEKLIQNLNFEALKNFKTRSMKIIGALNKESEVKIFTIDKLLIEKDGIDIEIKNFYIAVTDNKFESEAPYEALLNCLLLKEGW